MIDERNDDAAAGDNIAARLIRTAGRREHPPAAAYERSLRAATIAWEAKVRGRRAIRLAGWIAAGLALVSVGTWIDRRGEQPVQPAVARVERTVGTVQWQPRKNAQWKALAATDALTMGGTIRTLDGMAVVTLGSGVSVRIARTTELSLDSASRLHVGAGKVYVDTGHAAGAVRRIEIVTGAATVWDVGTGFEVMYRDDVYRLRVREGRVILQSGAREFDNRAGEQLTVSASGEVQREPVELSGAEWAWLEALALPPPIDEQPLTALLDWVARETGRPVRFASLDVREAAAKTVLHGKLGELAPLEALEAVLATTDLAYSLHADGTILIRRKSDHP